MTLIFFQFGYVYFYFQAKTPEDAEKGLLFMKEIVELSKSQVATSIAELQAVFFKKDSTEGGIELLLAGPSHFSKELTGNESIKRKVVLAQPFRLCSKLETPLVQDRILVVERGDCPFIDKSREGQKAGAAAIIVSFTPNEISIKYTFI